jgi:hypothetical protein
MDLPSSYARVEGDDSHVRAMSGDGVMVLMQRGRNIEGGTRAFWSKIIRRWIEGSKVVAISEVKEVAVAGGADGLFMVGTKEVGARPTNTSCSRCSAAMTSTPARPGGSPNR